MGKTFSRKELVNFDGKNSRPAYIAYNGAVYDVTDNMFWAEGAHLQSHSAGIDLTTEIDNAPHGEEVFEGLNKVGVLED